MHVIIHYYIKPVFFQAEIREQCRQESSTQTLGIQNPRGYKFNWSEKSIHPFVFKWNRFCAWFPLSVLFCCATEEMYNVFFSTRAPPTDFKDLGVPRKVPLGEDRLGSVPTHWSAEVFNENSFQLCPCNNPRLLMTFLQSTILAGDYWTSQSWSGGGLRSWL